MPTRTHAEEARPRVPLSRARVLQAAVALADRDGIGGLTMRKLADELGVEAMSIYHHVPNKQAVLDGIVEEILTEALAEAARLDLPDPADDWKLVMRSRILAARQVMFRHRWAPEVIETRTEITPTLMTWFESTLGVMIAGGFSYDLAHHAMHALGSRALGFHRELFEPDDPEAADADAEAMLAQMADQFPHIVTMVSQAMHDAPDQTLGWCDDQTEFEFALDLILDGLEGRRAEH